MGFELAHVLSDERHHGAFLCAICQNLCGLDALITTSCSHAFCRQCLETWLNRPKHLVSAFESYFGQSGEQSSERRCPTCNRDLSYQSHSHADGKTKSMMVGDENVDARPLSEVQPLAYRVLRRVKVECPLHEKHGCPWQGDYGDLQEHLISATAHRSFSDDNLNGTNVESTSRKIQDEDGVSADDVVVDESLPEQAIADMDVEPVEPDTNSSDSTRTQEVQVKRRRLAESFKEEANGKFSSHNFVEARDLYSKALSVMDNVSFDTGVLGEGEYTDKADRQVVAALRANRAAALLKLQDFQECVHDCDVAIHLDAGYEKAYIRKSRAQVELGHFEEAVASLNGACALNPESSVLKTTLSETKALLDGATHGASLLEKGEYALAKSTFGNLMLETRAIRVVLGAAWADCGLGLTESALRLSLQVIRRDNRAAEGYEVRGRCMCLMGEFENGMSLLRESLRLDPDCNRAMVELKRYRSVYGHINDARKAVFSRKFGRAVEMFTSALTKCHYLPPKAPLYSKLYSERAEAYLRLKDYDAALKDCALATYAREDCVLAWLTKAKAFHALGRQQEALEDMEDLMRKWGSGDSKIRAAYDRADFEVRKQKRPNFYMLFDIPKIASEMEIKKAYKLKAKEFHPDRFAGDAFTDAQRKEAEAKFQLLGEGFEILCDDFKRQLYDEGYDQEAIRERVAAAQRAAHSRQGRYPHDSGH